MSKPTVCFVHGDALDLFRGENGPRFGGSETQMYLLAKLLGDSGEFAARLVADKDVSGAEYPGVTFRSTVDPITHGAPYISRFINRARERRPYRDLDDAILMQTILGGFTVSTWRLARKLGLKFVYRMSCDADIDGSFFTPELRQQFHAPLLDADGVMAQSPYQQRRLKSELGVESTVVRSIVDLPDDGPALGGSHVVWAGRAAAVKRPWMMMQVARSLPEIEFVMLMPAEPGVEGTMFWQCVTMETKDIPNLTIVPGVSYFEMPEYLRRAAVFANTSAIEGVPSVFLQSAAQGTPIVSLDVDPDGMLAAEGFGYCAGGDIDKFRQAIVNYMASPRLVGEQGMRGFEFVQRHHSTEAVGPVFHEFLRSVFAH